MSTPTPSHLPPLTEVLQRLEQLVRAHPAARLLVDMAAAMPSRKRLISKNPSWRLCVVCVVVATAYAATTRDYWTRWLARRRLPGCTTASRRRRLRETYRQLRNECYPSVSRHLREVVGRGEPRSFQVMLVKRVMLRGQRALMRTLVSKPEADAAALCERLGKCALEKLLKYLGRRAKRRAAKRNTRKKHRTS
jgi:hypothetical protein